MSGLTHIATKDPIVATFDTQTLHTARATVCTTYDHHARTYVEQPAMTDLRSRFVEAVQRAHTPKACIVAPFGYGKTATAIGIWDACQQAGMLTVPPTACVSFAALTHAIYDWSLFALPTYTHQIHAAFERFLTQSADTLARRDEQQFQIPFDQAHAAISDKIRRGYLDCEDISVNLVAFLELMTDLAQQAGYQGLVVIVDELQQLIGNAHKGVLVALRQLIWGLRTRHIPFGILFTMDPDTEQTLADRAGDILHRIKDDGLYLDLGQVYDRDFPARLWQQYRTAFALSADEGHAIDHATLEALGQLCERDDLSNGPRTVINAFQCAAAHFRVTQQPYTPLHLIHDLCSGAIRFDGNRGVIPALVRELLSFPYFQQHAQRAATLQLIAVFPRGCPMEVARLYGLAHTWQTLNDDLRGEIVTELAEGLTLIELQRVGRPANRLNILLRRYWMQITDQQLFAETAPQVFRTMVLPLLFPPKAHDVSGWTDVQEVVLDVEGRYRGIIEGTSSSRYPLRRVHVVVMTATMPALPSAPTDDVDLTLGFRLDMRPDATSHVTMVAANYLEFHLALNRPAQRDFRGGLAWIAHYLSPHPISAAVVLSLLNYLNQEPLTDVSERDQVRIADTIARLHEWLLADLFPQDLLQSPPFTVVAAGASGFREFLHLLWAQRWPQYTPIATHQHWRALLHDYEQALEKVTPATRVGAMPQEGTKAVIAQLFRQKRHAGFASRARQYGELLHIEHWQGTQAIVRFRPHAAELHLAQYLRAAGALSWEGAYQQLRTQGFAAAEAHALLRLLLARGLASKQANQLVTPPQPTVIEVRTYGQALQQRCHQFPAIPAPIRQTLDALLTTLDYTEDLAQIRWEFTQLEQQLDHYAAQIEAEADRHHTRVRQQVLAAVPQLTLPHPHDHLGRLEKHIKAIFKALEADRHTLLGISEQLLTPTHPWDLDQANAFLQQVQHWEQQANRYRQWNLFAPRLTQLQTAVQRVEHIDPGLDGLPQQLELILRQARAVLARQGMAALGELGRFEIELQRAEQTFATQTAERSAAYELIATHLYTQLQQALAVPPVLHPPPYDNADDTASFAALFQWITTIANRSLTLQSYLFVAHERSDTATTSHAKICAKIQTLAQRAVQPDWLVQGNPPVLRRRAMQELQQLQERIAQELPTVASARSQLITRLVMSPVTPVDLTTILAQIPEDVEQTAVLDELIQLQRVGALQLTITYPERNHAASATP